MALGSIFSAFSQKTPAEKKSAALAAFSRKLEQLSTSIDEWLEDEGDRMDRQRFARLSPGNDGSEDDGPDGKTPLPVFRRDYALKEFSPADITPRLLDGLEGLRWMRDAAESLQGALLVEVTAAAEKPWLGNAPLPAHAVIRLTLDLNRPFSESRYVTPQAPEKTSAPMKGPVV